MQNNNLSTPDLYYHLSCDSCNKTWWMDDGFPAYCPFCGNERIKKFTTNGIIKDCTTCEHGKYNDRYETYFCYNNKKDCKEWNSWEVKRTCGNCRYRIYDLFNGDTYCPKQENCIKHSKWEERK